MSAAAQLDSANAGSVESHRFPLVVHFRSRTIFPDCHEIASNAANERQPEEYLTMPVHPNRWQTQLTTDRAAILSFLRKDRLYAAYAIGDLQPPMFERCTWAVATKDGRVRALALHFRGLIPPALFLMGVEGGLSTILQHSLCPTPVLVTCRSEHLPLVQTLYDLCDTALMWRMVLRPSCFRPFDRSCTKLCASQAVQLGALYALGGGDAFTPSQLQHGVFYGIEVDDQIVAVAGTHLVSPEYGVAAVGNVFTHPEYRGRGYASAATSAVVAALRSAGIRDIVLNVSQSNQAAIRIYERLGFERYCPFVEGPATRRT